MGMGSVSSTGAPSPPMTRAEWTDQQLRSEVLSGRLRPGDRVPVEQLADSWGVSATPIRESLRRLAGQGLIDLTPQRGARVAIVDTALAHEIYAVRLLLEPVALRQSLDAATHDLTFTPDVDAAFGAMLVAEVGVDRLDRHRAFHLTLMSRCPNRTLLDEIGSLMDRSRLFQFVSTSSHLHRRHARDHQRLRDAAIAGDIDGTITIHTTHLTATLDALS